MVIRYQRITIIKSDKPKSHGLNQELQWFGASLGLFGLRDKDKSCFRIFIALIKGLKNKKALSSDEISVILNLSRGTVVFHLNKLMDSGIVTYRDKRYFLNVSNLEELVGILKRNTMATFNNLKGVAQEIDKQLEL